MSTAEAGVYLLTGECPPGLGLRRCGPFWVGGGGSLFSEASNEDMTLLFEGVLLDDRQPDMSDAEAALHRVERGGPGALDRLDGFFRAILVEPQRGRATVVSDPLVTRPVYLYDGRGRAAVAPHVGFMVAAGLPMQLRRDALYQLFRLCHPVGPGSLLSPVERSRARTRYRITAEGGVEARRPPPLRKHEDPSIDLDQAATLIRDNQARVVRLLLTHPRLQGRAVHLPLTSGMDSRHLLGALLAADAAPERLCYVRVNPEEHSISERIAQHYGLTHVAPGVGELPIPALLRAFIRRSGGLIHIHQLYLLGVALDLPPSGVLGFDGYLADLLLGVHRLPVPMTERFYTRAPLPWLFPDHRALEGACREALDGQLAGLEGSEDFRISGLDVLNRGPWYTGGAFPLVDPAAAYFAPGAHRDALALWLTIPEAVARHKRARLHMFRRDFPDLAQFPGQSGVPFAELEVLPDHKASPLSRRLLAWARADRGTLGPQQWLRRVDTLRSIHARVVREAWLLRDGVLPRDVVEVLWRTHQLGARNAFALMSLTSAEIAYRIGVFGQSPDAVTDWLLGLR